MSKLPVKEVKPPKESAEVIAAREKAKQKAKMLEMVDQIPGQPTNIQITRITSILRWLVEEA